MHRFWRVEDGVLIGESVPDLKENYLWSEQSYGDFILEFDVRWTGEIDSGVEIRKPKMQLQLGVSRSLKLPRGPNNPVGAMWIGLDTRSYGIHGTPEPEKVGSAFSHGCVRLTNWDATALAQMVRRGTVVEFLD